MTGLIWALDRAAVHLGDCARTDESVSEPKYAQGGYIHSNGPEIPDALLSRIVDPGYVITREQAARLYPGLLAALNATPGTATAQENDAPDA